MAGNSFGNIFRITTFGESHGPYMGVVIDGCPSMIQIDHSFIQTELNRRKPGQSVITTARKEPDNFEIISGVFDGKTTGTPICVLVKNKDQKSKDYTHIKNEFRPSHADYTYNEKYENRDYRGGGRSSARETLGRVIGGAIAQLVLNHLGISVQGFVTKIGNIEIKEPYSQLNLDVSETNIVRCPEPDTAKEMETLVKKVKKEGDSIGGVVQCIISGCPVGLGEPVFEKLSANLAKAMMSINAAKGFELGSGFSSVMERGSKQNDLFVVKEGVVETLTNNSGGIQGGISNGMDIYFKVPFKPVATIMQPQASIDKFLNKTVVNGKGRHDPCVVPRAVPIVEAMARLVILDHLIIDSGYKWIKNQL